MFRLNMDFQQTDRLLFIPYLLSGLCHAYWLGKFIFQAPGVLSLSDIIFNIKDLGQNYALYAQFLLSPVTEITEGAFTRAMS